MVNYDPWTPQPGPVAQPGTLDQFGNFMDDPRARAALLSFGIAMMQPRTFGDTFTSQLGRGIGSAGEAVDRVDQQAMRSADQERKDIELGIKGQEADSRADLRAAQADSALSRAQTAETRAAAATDRLNFTQQQLDLRKQMLDALQARHGLSTRVRVQQMYNKDIEAINEANRDPLSSSRKGFIPAPIPSFDQWVQSKPEISALLGALPPLDPTSPTPTPTPSATPTPSPSSSIPAPTYPPLPRNPKDRRPGQVYSTPSGRNVQWDGKGLF